MEGNEPRVYESYTVYAHIKLYTHINQPAAILNAGGRFKKPEINYQQSYVLCGYHQSMAVSNMELSCRTKIQKQYIREKEGFQTPIFRI